MTMRSKRGVGAPSTIGLLRLLAQQLNRSGGFCDWIGGLDINIRG